MTYVRHRDRMIARSVFDDLSDTLIACRWMSGTTSRPVRDPESGVWGALTVAPDEVLPLLEGHEITLIDYFPEAEGVAVTGEPETGQTAVNTLAVDNGTRGDAEPLELGNSSAELIPYRFALALYAASDAVAQAVMADLADRYKGRIVRPDFVELWDYNSASTEPVIRMSAESFTFAMNDNDEIAPHEVHLYFGQLMLEDEVD